MVPTTKLSFRVSATGPNLRLIVNVDDREIYNDCPGDEIVTVEHVFDDSEDCTHVLGFELSGKTAEHTQISDTGEILQDRYVIVQDVAFDDIALGYMFTKLATYRHDTNGTSDVKIDKFHGVMGCNGRVEMPFSTPIYLWLLENI